MMSALNINGVDEEFDSEATQSAGEEEEVLESTTCRQEISSCRNKDLPGKLEKKRKETGRSAHARQVGKKVGVLTSAEGLCSASELNATTVDLGNGVESKVRGSSSAKLGEAKEGGTDAHVNTAASLCEESEVAMQSWRWELKRVEVERSFGLAPLSLRKWVRVPCKNARPTPKRHITIETARDGTQILVGGFMKYHCSHAGCGKVFATMGSLRKHMHIHEEKQFLCEHPGCGKRFIDRSKLKRHVATHNKPPRAQKKAKKK